MNLIIILLGVALLWFILSVRKRRTNTKTKTKTKEGFDDTVITQHQLLGLEGERRYNSFARLQHPTNTNAATLPADKVNAAFAQAIPVETSWTPSLMTLLGVAQVGAADDGSNKVGTGVEQTGVVQQKVDFCESLPLDCSLLTGDVKMAECGFCHRDGVNSKGKPHRGGMFISASDQIQAGADGVYKPTVWTCDPKHFSVMKDTCEKRELQLG